VVALLIGAGAAPALAQDQIETVVVTGFRASLATSLEAKKNSDLILESITPEDIGKMPDKDVAESLQRLPGVQIDRAAGEGTQVRIRGLSYNVTLLDGDVFVTGREMYTTGEGSGAGNGNEFQNSMEGIPSSLIAGVDVYKDPKASLVAGALGGTIDLRIRNALDGKDGLTIGGNIGGNYSEGAKNVTPGGAVVASYKFNEQLGVIAALSYDEHDVLVREAQSQNRNGWTVAGPATGVDNTIGKNYIEPELSYLTHSTVDRKRFGGFLGIDFNPIASVQTSLTWFHSKLDVDRRDITDKAFTHSNGEAQGLDPLATSTIDPNGVILQGTFRTHSAETAAMVEEDHNVADNIQANLKYDDGGKLRLNAKFAYGKGTLRSEFMQADVRPSGYGIDNSNGFFNGNTEAAWAASGHSVNTPWAAYAATLTPDQLAFFGTVANPYPTATYNSVTGTYTSSNPAFVDQGKYNPWSYVGNSNANKNYANPLGCGGNQGVNPGSPSCNFTYTNYKGLFPIVSYVTPDLLTNPAYIVFKSNWAWDVKSQNQQWSGRLDGEYDLLEKVTLSSGLRYATKNVNYDFGRYLANAYGNGNCSFGDNPDGAWDDTYAAGQYTVAGAYIPGTGGINGHNAPTHVFGGAGCPNGQGQLSWEGDQTIRGPWTYYQDPSLPNVDVQTGTSNPGRLAMVKDFFPAAGIQNLLTQNPALMAKAGPIGFLEAANPNIPVADIKRFKDVINSFKISNKVSEGYFMLDIGQPVDGFHINTGVRVVHTQLDIGQYTLGANPVYLSTASWNGLPNDAGATYGVTHRQYTDILPSLNAVVDIADGQKIRFAAARVMAEQNYWQLGAGFYTNFTHTVVGTRCNVHVLASTGVCSPEGFFFNSASGGNNQLDPYRANQMDLTYEWYFGTQGLLSGGLYWKSVDSFTQTAIISEVLPDDFGGTAGGVTTFTNGRGGRIEGVELNAQYAFENGFGFNANYTYAKSTTANASSFAAHLPFPGVAANAYTVQGYYENGPFQGRVSYTWKGGALDPNYSTFAFASICATAGCPAGGAINTLTYAAYDRSYGQIDAQVSYSFLDHFGIVLEGRNLGGSATSAYLQFRNQPFLYDQSGRSYAVNIKFNY
jgi:TonB-dependent receptor